MQKPNYYLEGLVNNDVTVVNEIYDSLFLKIRNFIINNKGQQEDAEDVFQKALMQLAVRYKKEKFTINSSFDAYLFTVCKNLWRRELNKNRIRVTNGGYIEPKDDTEDIALAVLEQKRWELFKESLELISENCKEILKLFFAKVTYAEMKERFNYSSETVVRQRVFKCKNSLKEHIKKDKRYKHLTQL